MVLLFPPPKIVAAANKPCVCVCHKGKEFDLKCNNVPVFSAVTLLKKMQRKLVSV